MKPVDPNAVVDVNLRSKKGDYAPIPQKYLVQGIEWPMARTVRMSISRALRSYLDNGLRPPPERRRVGEWKRYLGCGIMTFAEHLQAEWFDEMKWENYGSLWELNYIKPLSDFDMSKDENMLAAFNFKNIQPRLVKDRTNAHKKDNDPYEYLRNKATFPPFAPKDG